MNLVNTFLLGLAIALMLYSKYHGVLIVFFTLLSNPKLLTRYQTYVAAVMAFLLFIPHVYWQFQHELPSVQYHLFERNASHYKLAFTTEYIIGQIALAGPLIGWLFIYASMKYKPLSATEKALKWSLAGIYIFFLLSTFKGRVEANWTIPAFVALIVLSHQYISDRPRLQRWVYRTVPFTLLLVLGGRIFMGLDLPKSSSFSKDEFHGNREWVQGIESRANNENVVVINSYQSPSKYWFYSGKPALGLNTAEYRRNNFNFWPIEKNFIGKPALVMGAFDSVYLNDRFTSHLRESGSMHVPFYYSLSAIQIKQIKSSRSDEHVSIRFQADIPADYINLLTTHPIDTAQLYVAIIYDNKPVEYIPTGFRVSQLRGDKAFNQLSFQKELPQGYISLKLAISSVIPGRPSVNSTNFTIQ
jgi:hypothetical protein